MNLTVFLRTDRPRLGGRRFGLTGGSEWSGDTFLETPEDFLEIQIFGNTLRKTHNGKDIVHPRNLTKGLLERRLETLGQLCS